MAKDLSSWSLINLPNVKANQVPDLFVKYIKKQSQQTSLDGDIAYNIMEGLANLQQVKKQTAPYFSDLVESCVAWKRKEVQHPSETDISLNKEDEYYIAILMADVLLPNMDEKQITDKAKKAWLNHLKNVDNKYFVLTAYQYWRLFPQE